MKNIIIAFLALIIIALSAVIALIPFVPAIGEAIGNFTDFMKGNAPFAAIPALVLGLSLWLFFAQLTRSGPQVPSTVVLQAEGGEVRIALGAIDTLVKQAANQFKEVREIKTSFFTGEEGLGTLIRLTITGDESIPNLTTHLQEKVLEHVYNIAGIKLEQIKVLVENVAVGVHNRAELR